MSSNLLLTQMWTWTQFNKIHPEQPYKITTWLKRKPIYMLSKTHPKAPPMRVLTRYLALLRPHRALLSLKCALKSRVNYKINSSNNSNLLCHFLRSNLVRIVLLPLLHLCLETIRSVSHRLTRIWAMETRFKVKISRSIPNHSRISMKNMIR